MPPPTRLKSTCSQSFAKQDAHEKTQLAVFFLRHRILWLIFPEKNMPQQFGTWYQLL